MRRLSIGTIDIFYDDESGDFCIRSIYHTCFFEQQSATLMLQFMKEAKHRDKTIITLCDGKEIPPLFDIPQHPDLLVDTFGFDLLLLKRNDDIMIWSINKNADSYSLSNVKDIIQILKPDEQAKMIEFLSE